MAMLLSSLKDAAIRTGPGGEKGPCTQLQLLLCSLVLVKSIFFINEISVCIKWFVLNYSSFRMTFFIIKRNKYYIVRLSLREKFYQRIIIEIIHKMIIVNRLKYQF